MDGLLPEDPASTFFELKTTCARTAAMSKANYNIMGVVIFLYTTKRFPSSTRRHDGRLRILYRCSVSLALIIQIGAMIDLTQLLDGETQF